jgi:perosamine synthetase
MKDTTSLNPQHIVDALKAVLPDGAAGLHEPEFAGNEWDYVKECLDTGWVSSAGSYVSRFEDMLAKITETKHAIAVINGSAALHAGLLLTDIEQDDEVIIPTLTFVATANAVSYCNAVPHFADCDERTLGINPDKLSSYLADIADIRGEQCFNKKTNRRIKALIVMHTFGHASELDTLKQICDRYGIAFIEDAAEAIGTLYKGKHVGNHGLISILSFNGNKTITTGGGGAILTNDDTIADKARHLTDTAKVPHRWMRAHDLIGFNYRMTNINAALGCAQLEKLGAIIERKRNLAAAYKKAFSLVAGVTVFSETPVCKSNYWLNTIILDPEYADQRDAVLEATNDAGLRTQPAWTPMHKLSMYQECPRMDLSAAESLYDRAINLPSSSFLVDGLTT